VNSAEPSLPNDRGTPNVLLLRDRTSYTSIYLERALACLSNVKGIQVNWPPGFEYLRRKAPRPIGTWLLNRALHEAMATDPAFKRIDLALVVDPLRIDYVPSALGCTTAYYAIDSHLAFRQHIELARAPEFDVVFVAQKDYVKQYRESGCDRVEWLPLAFDPMIHRKMNLEKRRRITFVGNPWRGTERGKLLEGLEAAVGLEVHRAYLHDMVRLYNQSKVVFNRSLKGDVNMRVFEALGCGAFLLTDQRENGMGDLFIDRQHLATYGSLEEAVDLARYYLEQDLERERIALEGHRHARAHHTYFHRAADVLRACLDYELPRSVISELVEGHLRARDFSYPSQGAPRPAGG